MVAINANELDPLIKVDLNESKKYYGVLFEKVTLALVEADPMNFKGIEIVMLDDDEESGIVEHLENVMLDEYDGETSTILPRLDNAKCAEDVALIVYEEFLKWFDTWTYNSFKTVEEFQPVAKIIWDIWRAYKIERL